MTEASQDFARDLTDASVHWMDALWDPDAGLVWSADRTRHLVRESSWYALGLLTRQAPGDADRAHAALHAVLNHQYDVAGAVHHGTFRRAPEETVPPPRPRMWVDYDPNWRQFIGTTLAILVDRFITELPTELVGRIDRALSLCVDGEPPGRVTAAYSNIALMKAWLDVFVGERAARPDLLTDGAGLSMEVVQRFERNTCFDEYNSPTYYGVDLYALGLWRSCGPPLLREVGHTLEDALWREIARSYHAGLRNLCGPFDRSYGMDMRRYAALVGMCFWAALGRGAAPFPRVSAAFGHANDLCMGPCLATVGIRIPSDILPDLEAFRGERTFQRTITDSPRRAASAWLSDRVMLGGQDASGTRSAVSQYHPATMHFSCGDGSVGWMRVRSAGRVDATVGDGELQVRCGPHPDRGPQPVTFEIDANRISSIKPGQWHLPGVDVELRTDAVNPRSSTGDDGAEISFEPQASGHAQFLLRVSS